MRLYVVMAIALLSLSAVAQGRKPQDRCTFVTDTVMVHDPVMAVEDGLCHLFSTGNGLQHATSADRRTWTVHEEPVLADIPAWTRDSVPGFNRHVWAPDVKSVHVIGDAEKPGNIKDAMAVAYELARTL